MLTALLLTLLAIFCIFDSLGPSLILASRPLIAGTIAGIIVGDLTLGMAIGASLEFLALGSYTYGGATTPDWATGAIIGTAITHNVAGSLSFQTTSGIAIGLIAATILIPLDPLGRLLPTFWIHRADQAAAAGRTREMTLLHWTAFIPWAAVRAVPTFLAVYFLDKTVVANLQHSLPQWLIAGLGLAGGMLPAVGFAMLLNMLPTARYWYMLLIGYVLFAYLKVPVLGIALFGIAIAIIFVTLKPSPPPAETAAPANAEGEPSNV